MLVRLITADRFIQADHSLLNHVIPVSANEKIGSCLDSNEIFVSFQQSAHGIRILMTSQHNELLI